MLWILVPFLGILPSVCINLAFLKGKKKTFKSVFEGCAFLFGILISAALILSLALSVFYGPSIRKDKMTFNLKSDTEIISVVGTNQFILGTTINKSPVFGENEESRKYVYAVKTEDGYQLNRLSAKVCSIEFTDGPPHIEEYTYTYNTWFLRNVLPFRILRFYKLYIPENSAISNFGTTWEW